MIDLLNLPGVKPVDIRNDGPGIIISAITAESDRPAVCETCGGPMYRHGTRTNTFADTALHGRPAKIEITRHRYRCPACRKIVTPQLSFLDEKRHATKRLVQAIHARCLTNTFTHLANETGVTLNTIKSMALDLVDELDKRVRYRTPVLMGIDEVNIAGNFRCVIVNLERRSVFQILPQRTKDTLIPYFKSLPNADEVLWVVTDMWRPYEKSFKPHLANARVVIDKFHVVRMASEALEAERKRYQRILTKDDRLFFKKNMRWLTLRRPDRMTDEQLLIIELMRERVPELGYAYDLKESFYKIYDAETKDEALAAFDQWKKSVPNGMPGFASLVKTVNNHHEGIFAYWDAPVPLTNAYTEAKNGVIKVANRMGRGYSFEVIRAKFLYTELARQIGASVDADKLDHWGLDQDSRDFFNFTEKPVSTIGTAEISEYGAYIPTLVGMAEEGSFD